MGRESREGVEIIVSWNILRLDAGRGRAKGGARGGGGGGGRTFYL